MGWTFGLGPGCDQSKVGQLVSKRVGGENDIFCYQGCGAASVKVTDVSYYCKGANPSEQWEQGEKTFTFDFTGLGPGPYTIA